MWHESSGIYIKGIDASEFLQGQLTCDVMQLKPEQQQFTALCTPIGRVRATLNILKTDINEFVLYLPASQLNSTVELLKKYARFSRVTLEAQKAPVAHQINFFDDIRKNLPYIYPATSEKFLPHDLSLQMIPGAISFNKGCYMGQEIIARMHYRAELKYHLIQLAAESTVEWQPGTSLVQQEKKIGIVIDSIFIKENKFLSTSLQSVKAVAVERSDLTHHFLQLRGIESLTSNQQYTLVLAVVSNHL